MARGLLRREDDRRTSRREGFQQGQHDPHDRHSLSEPDPFLSLTLSVLPAAAADGTDQTTDTRTVVANARVSQALSRPAALSALYASYAALQAFDVHTTRRALALGGREGNPLMGKVVATPAALVALKAGVAVGTVLVTERIWKTNRTAAIAVMAASNTVAALVATHNSRTLRRLR